MQILKKLLMGNEKNLMGKGALWNIISSVEYSMQSAILVLIITRSSGLFDAGVFTIAYSLTQMMATIGSYGMRSFQVSDIKREYNFETYFSSRMISVFAMIVVCMSYAFMQGYDNKKMILIATLCLYRVVDDVEDVFHGEMQKTMRLDIAAKIVSIRIFIATVVFGIVYVITSDLIVASILLTVSAIIISFVLNYLVVGNFEHIKLEKNKRESVLKLLFVCLPICVGGFLYNYLVNAPKYAIDRLLSEETQTIFSILFMPVFVINILSSFIFKPMIVNMGIMWNNNQKAVFIKKVAIQVIIIVVLTVIVMVGGGIIGIDILGFMYGVNLDEYRMFFVMLIGFGGIAAMSAFLVDVMTIIRKQNFIIVAYGIAMLIDWIFIDKMVSKYEIWGAGVIYGVAMAVVMLVLLSVLAVSVFSKRKDTEDGRVVKESIS